MSDVNDDDLIPNDHPAVSPAHADADLIPDDHPSVPAAHKGTPVFLQAPPETLDDPDLAASPKQIARASLAPQVATQKKRYAAMFKQPETDFTIDPEGVIWRKVPGTNNVARVESTLGGSGKRLKRAEDWVASGAGPAIPRVAGALGAAGAGALGARGGPGAATTAAIIGGALTQGAAEYGRQKWDQGLADDGTETDWDNVGWHALEGASILPAGKLMVGAGKLIGKAGGKLMNTGPAVALRQYFSTVPGLNKIISAPSYQPVAQTVENPLGLTDDAIKALQEHLASPQGQKAMTEGTAAADAGLKPTLGQRTGSELVKILERAYGRTMTGIQQFANRRAEQVASLKQTVDQHLDDLAPAAAREDQVGALRQGAEDVEKSIKLRRAEKAAPHYESAFAANGSVDSPAINRMLRSPAGKKSLDYAIERMQNRMENVSTRDPELTEIMRELQAIGQMPAGNPEGVGVGFKLKTLDYVKGRMWELEKAARKRALTGVQGAEGEAADLATLRQNFTRELDANDVTARAGPKSLKAAGGDYAKARKIYGDESEELDSVMSGGVGALRKMRGMDRENMLGRFFGGEAMMPREITAARQAFFKAGKGAEWNKALRGYLEQTWGKALEPTMAGSQSNPAGKLADSLFDSEAQRKTLMAAIGDPAKVQRWEKLGQSLSAMRQVLAEGSPTITDAEILKTGSLQKVANFVGQIFKAKHGDISAATNAAIDWQSESMRKKMIGVLLDDDSNRALATLMQSMPSPQQMQTNPLLAKRGMLMLNTFLGSTGLATGENKVRKPLGLDRHAAGGAIEDEDDDDNEKESALLKAFRKRSEELTPEQVAAIGTSETVHGGTPKALAETASSFVPGVGLMSAFGKHLEFDENGLPTGVGDNPSLVENVKGGHYGHAALQALGAIPDAGALTYGVGRGINAGARAADRATGIGSGSLERGMLDMSSGEGITPPKLDMKRVDAAIGKINDGVEPTALQMKALEDAARTGHQKSRNAIVKLNPELENAPRGVANMADLDAWRAKWKSFHDQGAGNEGWYEHGADADAAGFSGDPERIAAFADAKGAASQRTAVGQDANYALGQHYRAEYGLPLEVQPGEHIPEVQAKIISGYQTGSPMASGPKVGPFSQAVASGGAEPAGQGVWDSIGLRGAGYHDNVKASQAAPFLDRETARLAPGVPIHGPQARVWEGIKKAEGTSDGRYHYGDWNRESAGNMVLEAQPGATSALHPELHSAPPEVKREYFERWKQDNVDQFGNDQIARDMGFLQVPGRDVLGAFESKVNPARLVQLVMPRYSKGGIQPPHVAADVMLPVDPGVGALDPHSVEMLNGLAIAHGVEDMQDAMAWHRPFVDGGGGAPRPDDTFFHLSVGQQGAVPRALSEGEQGALYKRLMEISGGPDLLPIAAPGGANFLKFDWVLGNDTDKYLEAITRAADDVLGSGNYGLITGKDQRFYKPNDWKGGTDASAYLEALAGLRPEVGRRVSGVLAERAPRIDQRYTETSRAFGWRENPDVRRFIEGLGNSGGEASLRPAFGGIAGQRLIPVVQRRLARKADVPFARGGIV